MNDIFKMFYALFFLSILLVVNASAQDSEKSEPATVSKVDLQKYAGTWYEIAKIPNRFQKSCAKNTTATYKLREDGKIDVINKCIEDNGEVNEADGIAKVADGKTNSKLEVSFVSILGFHLFWGDYWIIGLDDNYRYAVVGTPTRKYGWILSRTKKLSEDDLQKIFSILREQAYDPNKFIMTKQD